MIQLSGCVGVEPKQLHQPPLLPSPPWSLHAPMMTPTRLRPIYSEQTEGGLAQTAAICKKHSAGRTLAASDSLISCTQLFPFVMVDCG